MIIDFHTHTFPEKIAEKALCRLSRNSHSRPHTDGTDEGLVLSMRESGVDCSVILPVATSAGQVMHINDSAARKAEERAAKGLISFGAMHPDFADYRGELLRIRENGMRGIKLHPVYQDVDLDDLRMLRIYDRCAELGLMVVLHAGFDIGFPGVDRCSPDLSLHALRELKAGKEKLPADTTAADRASGGAAGGIAPGFRFILAHMGGWRQWDRVLELAPAMKEAGPVMIDTAFSDGAFEPLPDGYWKEGENAMLSQEGFMRIIRAFGTDRVLFATDSPWSVQTESLAFMRALPLTDAERAAILGRNAERLLWPVVR